MKPRSLKTLRPLLVLLVLALLPAPAREADESVQLRYTYKTDQVTLGVLRDNQGKAYLPLMETAAFYGVKVDFDAQARRVTLEKGKGRGKTILSQPVFLLLDPEASLPIDPLEMVAGQLAIPAQTAEDIFGTLLNIPVRYLPDQQVLAAGGVKDEDIRQEILAQGGTAKAHIPQPASSAAAGTTPVESPAAAPSLGPSPTVVTAQAPTPVHRVLSDQPPSSKAERVRRIIIDAGHGGYDAGAPSKDRRYKEKQATLDIAKKVVALLKDREDEQVEVLMTRKADYYITLKYRTDYANSHKGDLFVSIHCNSNPRPGAHGTEVYTYGSKASNSAAARAAHRENSGTDFLDYTMADMRSNLYKSRSGYLAELVVSKIVENTGQHFRNIQKAPFYVLAHADMPSILVETAFISNPQEVIKLRDPYWRDKMAKAIAEGILAYKDRVEGL